LTEVVAIAATEFHSLALKKDGTVVGWGWNKYGQSTAPKVLSRVSAIAACGTQSLALYGDISASAVITASSSPEAGGSITGAETYFSGVNVTLVATINSGYWFSNWTEAGIPVSSSPSYRFVASTNRTLVANFVHGCNIQASASPASGGSVTGAGAFDLGANITLNAAPNDGYIFVNWTEAGTPVSSSPIFSFVGESNRVLVANFLPGCTISVTASPIVGGVVTSGGSFAIGSAVTLSATPDIGFRFINWTEGGIPVSADPIYSFVASTNRTLVAKFLAASGAISDWGSQADFVPNQKTNHFEKVAAGAQHSLGLRADGRIVAWGINAYGQCSVPGGLSVVTNIAAGFGHSLALENDGTVVAWGWNIYGQSAVPANLTGIMVIAITAGYGHSLALKNDGSVVAWGANTYGQCTVPNGLTGVVAIAAGYGHSLALKNDGTVVAWGANTYGQRTVPDGLSGVTPLAAGDYHCLALKQDGTVVAWGANTSGQCTIPSGLTGVISIAAGQYHSLALKGDGTVVAWGNNASGQSTIPAWMSGVTAIAAGGDHSLALFDDGGQVANLKGLTVTSGKPAIHFIGVPGIAYDIVASPDLSSWSKIGTATAGPAGSFDFVDDQKGGLPMRFYRAKNR
jgi:alpha-tubulin suppressor-like RCC1 family protein